MNKIKISLVIFALLGLLILSAILKPYYSFLTKTLKISPLKTLLSLDSLKTYDNNATILILGIAGANHQGPNLSDSIIVANYNLKTHQFLTISIPRDIWSSTLQDKINTAYAYGEAKQVGGGLKLAKAEIEAVVGIPVQYASVIDFNKFEELIDFLGGIDVNVERSFTDKQFPIAGKEDDECAGDPEFHCRYETVSFTQGKTHMDGKTALKFVRSRHAEGDEGSDFARTKRQQKVLDAIKIKLMLALKKFDLKYYERLYNVVERVISRDMTNQQLSIVAKNILLSRNFTQKEIVLPEDFFIVPDYSLYNGKYVLIPKDKDFSKIHSYVLQVIKKN